MFTQVELTTPLLGSAAFYWFLPSCRTLTGDEGEGAPKYISHVPHHVYTSVCKLTLMFA